VTVALALGGPLAVVRDWLERFAIWIVYASTAAVAIALFLHGLNPNLRPAPVAGNFLGASSLLLGLDLVVAMPISWWPLISDYNRFAARPRQPALGTTLGSGAATTAFYALGAGLPLLGVVVADSVVVRRATYSADAFFAAAPRWRCPAFASWIPGAALYFTVVLLNLPVGATLPSLGLAAALQIAFSKVDASLTRPT